MIMSKNHPDKMLYPLTDNEEAMQIAQAKILTENFRNNKLQADVGVGNSLSNENFN
jgi:hypothetical protein